MNVWGEYCWWGKGSHTGNRPKFDTQWDHGNHILKLGAQHLVHRVPCYYVWNKNQCVEIQTRADSVYPSVLFQNMKHKMTGEREFVDGQISNKASEYPKRHKEKREGRTWEGNRKIKTNYHVFFLICSQIYLYRCVYIWQEVEGEEWRLARGHRRLGRWYNERFTSTEIYMCMMIS